MDRLKNLLIIEDDPGLQKQLKWSFENYCTLIAGNRQEAMALLNTHKPLVVTLDLGLPPDAANASEGLRTLKEILQMDPHCKVIVVTGNDDREHALQAVALGAYDFYQKPVDPDVLNLIVERAFQLARLEMENLALQRRPQESLTGIIGSCDKMLHLSRMVEKIAPSNVTVLLLGESGTGKELFAKAIHQLSERADKPFVAVNCAAIPESLLESELFGYEKGAFTGAVKTTKGKIEYAQGGTFFLDEIGDLPFALQAKLLRFIQERRIERLGGREEIAVDVRIVCATHQDMHKLIEEGRFREDLYYRISEMSLSIPPLRERNGDTLLIAKALLKKISLENGKKFKGFTEDALTAMANYAWPGNVRQLENKIKRAVVVSEHALINQADLELQSGDGEESGVPNLKQVRENAETSAIKKALEYANNNVSNAAKLLGVTRPTLYALLEKYGIHLN